MQLKHDNVLAILYLGDDESVGYQVMWILSKGIDSYATFK